MDESGQFGDEGIFIAGFFAEQKCNARKRRGPLGNDIIFDKVRCVPPKVHKCRTDSCVVPGFFQGGGGIPLKS